jgi:hypothetical protein
MWLLERLYPDYKSIAEFRRMHREAVTAAGAQLVGFAKSCGLIRGEWIAVDGSKFRAVASIDTARERFQLQRYLDSMEQVDSEQASEVDSAAVQAALEKLKRHPEPEAGFMMMGGHTQPAYNLQSAVDAEHALIIAHDVVLDATDNRHPGLVEEVPEVAMNSSAASQSSAAVHRGVVLAADIYMTYI